MRLVPKWINESKQQRIAHRLRTGGREVDEEALASYSKWRDDADPDNLSLLDFYSSYLVGQYAGMGNALDLGAVRVAFDLEGLDRDDWSDMTARLIYLHSIVVEYQEK